MGITDTDAMVENIFMVSARRRRAREDGYFVEAIALTAHVYEFFLTMWMVGKHRAHVSTNDSTTLGGWIGKAEKAGFDEELIRRLREFNQLRRLAVHRLLRGEIRYEALEDALSADPKLPKHLTQWVIDDMSGGTVAARPRAT